MQMHGQPGVDWHDKLLQNQNTYAAPLSHRLTAGSGWALWPFICLLLLGKPFVELCDFLLLRCNYFLCHRLHFR